MNTVIRSILIGVVAGMRSLTPLAVIGNSRRGSNASGANPFRTFLARPLVRAGVSVLAGGELLGDKWHRAPDRIVTAGLLARASSGAIAGAALAPRNDRAFAALVGAGAALGFGFVSFHLRQSALRRFGQASTGVVEDAIAAGLAFWLVETMRD